MVAAPPETRPQTNAKARRPGRPRVEATNQRAHLLDVARTVFTREGIAATRLRTIAREAGVTPALLNYYFGGKPQLVEAVIEESLTPLITQLRELVLAAGDDISAMVSGFVIGVHAAVAAHPWLPALWVREFVSEGGALRELLLARIAPPLAQLLATRFAAAQRRGEINPDLDPGLLVVSLVSLTLHPFTAAPLWGRVFASPDVGRDTLLHHTFALLDRGLGLPTPLMPVPLEVGS